MLQLQMILDFVIKQQELAIQVVMLLEYSMQTVLELNILVVEKYMIIATIFVLDYFYMMIMEIQYQKIIGG